MWKTEKGMLQVRVRDEMIIDKYYSEVAVVDDEGGEGRAGVNMLHVTTTVSMMDMSRWGLERRESMTGMMSSSASWTAELCLNF